MFGEKGLGLGLQGKRGCDGYLVRLSVRYSEEPSKTRYRTTKSSASYRMLSKRQCLGAADCDLKPGKSCETLMILPTQQCGSELAHPRR